MIGIVKNIISALTSFKGYSNPYKKQRHIAQSQFRNEEKLL